MKPGMERNLEWNGMEWNGMEWNEATVGTVMGHVFLSPCAAPVAG